MPPSSMVRVRWPRLSGRSAAQARGPTGAPPTLLDSGAPYYDTYLCADGAYVAVGALEPQFYAQLLAGLRLDPAAVPDQQDRTGWSCLRTALAGAFATRTRDEWTAVFADTDACVTPVLSFAEATEHPHLTARGTLPTLDGIPGPALLPHCPRPTKPSVTAGRGHRICTQGLERGDAMRVAGHNHDVPARPVRLVTQIVILRATRNPCRAFNSRNK